MAWLTGLGTRAQGLPLVALLALVLALVGGGHQPQTAIDDPALQAYLDAGGSLADICGQTDGGAVPVAHCPLCVLAHAAVLPQADFAVRRAPATFRLVTPGAARPLPVPRPIVGLHGIRAPPVLA